VHLSLLDSPTCVGFSTVTVSLTLEIFLGSSSPQVGNLLLNRLQTVSWNIAPDLPEAILETINAYTNIALEVRNFVIPLEKNGSAGILTSLSIGYAPITKASS
jgi:hypothetical protein